MVRKQNRTMTIQKKNNHNTNTEQWQYKNRTMTIQKQNKDITKTAKFTRTGTMPSVKTRQQLKRWRISLYFSPIMNTVFARKKRDDPCHRTYPTTEQSVIIKGGVQKYCCWFFSLVFSSWYSLYNTSFLLCSSWNNTF